MSSATPLRRISTEADATSTPTLFVEWARAHGATPPGAEALVRWALSHPELLAAFAGLSPMRPFRANLLRHTGNRAALIMNRRVWTRDQLRAGDDLPDHLALWLRQGQWDELMMLAAHHLLAVDTRPDDLVPWSGDTLTLGAWLVGAGVIAAPP